ncbi:MAG: RsmD family RNA methyltransferase [Planctomycetes bacterium]|nr:RsmD family RNA methyltransferase [Planctomycetota bacterium]
MKRSRPTSPTSRRSPAKGDDSPNVDSPPRIIGGELRGKRLCYSGDLRTRPMKDRVREAVFNLLGLTVKGRHALDLFAGTGALGFEALSRGAARATFFEQHFPTADLIGRSAEALGVLAQCQVLPANTFIQFRRAEPIPNITDPAQPWVVFVSPPYAFYVEREAEMLTLLNTVIERAPPGSMVVVEADKQFDFAKLPDADHWNIRDYSPAIVGLWPAKTRE